MSHLAAVRAEKWNTLSLARPLGTDRKASISSGWAGTTRERSPLPCLTVTAGAAAAAAKFRSRHCRPISSAWRSASQQQGKHPGPTGGHDGQDLPDLFLRPAGVTLRKVIL